MFNHNSNNSTPINLAVAKTAQLALSDYTWSLFDEPAARKATVHRFILPVCAIPLSDQPSPTLAPQNTSEPPRISAAEFTRIKTAAIIRLSLGYFPQAPVEVLIGDSLSLDNHPQADTDMAVAMKDIQDRKRTLKDHLAIPFDQLSDQQQSLSFTYSPPSNFVEYFPSFKPPVSQEMKLSSLEKYTTPEVKDFMRSIRDVLKQILTQEHPEEILLDENQLFSDQALGFAKKSLEERITQELGYMRPSAEFKTFIPGFMLSALHYLKTKHGIKTPLSADFKSADFTQRKRALYFEMAAKIGPHELLTDLVGSFCYITQEFCVFHDMLVRLPRKEQVPDNHLIYVLYPLKHTAPPYHPLSRLEYFLSVKLASRRFLALQEFHLSNNNRSDPSSTGDSNMNSPLPPAFPRPKRGSFGSAAFNSFSLERSSNPEAVKVVASGPSSSASSQAEEPITIVNKTPSPPRNPIKAADMVEANDHKEVSPDLSSDSDLIQKKVAAWVKKNVHTKPTAVDKALDFLVVMDELSTSPKEQIIASFEATNAASSSASAPPTGKTLLTSPAATAINPAASAAAAAVQSQTDPAQSQQPSQQEPIKNSL